MHHVNAKQQNFRPKEAKFSKSDSTMAKGALIPTTQCSQTCLGNKVFYLCLHYQYHLNNLEGDFGFLES